MMQLKEIIKKRIRNNRGFTLIEVIAVLVILAILTAVVISRDTATEEAKLRAEVDTLKAHLRYAQYLAMNDIAPNKWGIEIGGSSYKLAKVDNSGSTSPYSLPGESSETHNFPTGTSASVFNVLFDELGSPYNGSTKLTNTALTVTLTQGSQSKSIEITPETGFIE